MSPSRAISSRWDPIGSPQRPAGPPELRDRSAKSRQLEGGGRLDSRLAATVGAYQRERAVSALTHGADDPSSLPLRMPADELEDVGGRGTLDDHAEAATARQVQRIGLEPLGGDPCLASHRQAMLFQFDRHAGGARELVEDRGKPAAQEIAHAVDLRRVVLQHVPHKAPERRAVAGDSLSRVETLTE